jgi:hypothetical protein
MRAFARVIGPHVDLGAILLVLDNEHLGEGVSARGRSPTTPWRPGTLFSVGL